MKGSILRETFKPSMVYMEEDTDIKTDRPFIMVVVPLEEESFYLNKIGKDYTSNGWYDEKDFDKWEITGEAYIFEGANYKKRANEFARESRLELKGKEIIFQDNNLNLIKKYRRN